MALEQLESGDDEEAVKEYLKLCLEDRIGKRIPSEHPLLAWLVRHTAWLLSVRIRGDDETTAHERLRGEPFARRPVAFGEDCI